MITQRRVFVRDLEVMASLGIYDHEKASPQRVIINIDLEVDAAASADDVSTVVSYETVVKNIEAIIARGHINLAETLAEDIAAMCMADNRVSTATIRVEKPDIIANTRSVGVEITVRRQDQS